MRIAIASDQEGREAKQRIATKLMFNGHEVRDALAPQQNNADSDYAERVALAVLRHDAERGIIITARVVGASVAANRVPGVRAAFCGDPSSAHLGASEEGMNVLILAHTLSPEQQDVIVQAYLQATLAAVDVTGGLPPRRLQALFSHIRQNIAGELRVAELAGVVSMSQYYFSKLFKTSTGMTPHQYVMRQRVEHAQDYLRQTRMPLAEVASRSGFETQSHFTSVFRHIAGTTPKRYRDMYKGSHSEQSHSNEENTKAATAA